MELDLLGIIIIIIVFISGYIFGRGPPGESPQKENPQGKNHPPSDDDILRNKIRSRIMITPREIIKFSNIVGNSKAKKVVMKILGSPGGVILHGPPGTGKTLLAKAAASELKVKFFYISSSNIKSHKYGEGEKFIEETFNMAREVQPSIIFIDEADGLLGDRNRSDNDVTHSMINVFLSQMDGMETHCQDKVATIIATNKYDYLDEAVHDRLSIHIPVDLPNAYERYLLISMELRKKFPYNNNFLAGEESNILTRQEYIDIVAKTAGFSCRKLTKLVGLAKQIADTRYQISDKVGHKIVGTDFNKALNEYWPDKIRVPPLSEEDFMKIPKTRTSRELLKLIIGSTSITTQMTCSYVNKFWRETVEELLRKRDRIWITNSNNHEKVKQCSSHEHKVTSRDIVPNYPRFKYVTLLCRLMPSLKVVVFDRNVESSVKQCILFTQAGSLECITDCGDYNYLLSALLLDCDGDCMVNRMYRFRFLRHLTYCEPDDLLFRCNITPLVAEDRLPSLLDYINDAVLAKIIGQLSFKDRVKIERVCKRFQKVSLDVNSKKQTSLAIFGRCVSKNLNPNFCSTHSHRITKADIIDRDWFLRDLRPLFKRVPSLKSLHLHTVEYEAILTNEEVIELTTLLPGLEHFSFIDDKRRSINRCIPYIVRELPKLIHIEIKFPCRERKLPRANLILNDALTILKERLEVFSTNVPLSLSNCKLISNTCNKLSKMSVLENSLSKPALEALFSNGTCRGNLETFNINVDNEDQLQTIASNMLVLKSFHCVIDEKCDVYDISAIGLLKSVNHLFLSCWTKDVLDAGLVRIFIGCKQLTSLIITGEISDKSFELLSNFNLNLRRIELNNSSGDKIKDPTMYAFQKLDYLQSLSIYACDACDASIATFFENGSKHLNYFRIHRSNSLSKAIFPPIIEYASSNKQRIQVILPARLKPFWPQYLEYVPENLVVKFESAILPNTTRFQIYGSWSSLW